MDGNQLVARFIQNTAWDDLPAEVQQKVTLCFLDALGAALSGTLAGISQISTDFATGAMKGDEATILLQRCRATAAGAAFANANAANGFDIDDDNVMVKGHVGAQLIPAALAVAEKHGRSGRDLLTALAIGFEVAFRVGRCWHDHHQTWRAGGSWGSVANAAAAAHLMGLTEEQSRHALGIAEYHAPLIPIKRDIEHPAMVKHGIGWGAMNGIMAAELAALGYTGIPSILGFAEYGGWVSDIGGTYLIGPVLGFKEIPGCAYAHLPIYAVREIRQDHDFTLDDIDAVIVETFDYAIWLPTEPPTTTENAQFSVTWPLACELLYGEFGPRQMLDEALADERAVALMEKIVLVENERYTELCHRRDAGDPEGSFISRVVIRLKDGQEYSAVRSQHSFGLQLSAGQLVDKFRWLVSHVLPRERIYAIVETVLGMDQLSAIQELIVLVE
jgi:2-methylcitrate dehydratase PrpD